MAQKLTMRSRPSLAASVVSPPSGAVSGTSGAGCGVSATMSLRMSPELQRFEPGALVGGQRGGRGVCGGGERGV